MKAALRGMLCLAMVFAVGVVAVARAEDDKDKKDGKKTLKGDLGCAKCVFKVDGVTKCTNAIKIKEGDKEVIYIFQDKGRAEKYHAKICTSEAKGSVTGTVSKKGKQSLIKPDKDGVKYDDD